MSGCKQDPCKPCYPYPNPGGCCEDGKSAFEIWRENQPHGADISLEAFLKYMEGKKGDKGDQGEPGADGAPGKSAYEIWKEQQPPESDTSLEAYLNAIKGEKGDPGEPGAPGQDGQPGQPGANGRDAPYIVSITAEVTPV